MFIVSLTYKVSLEVVNQHLNDHIDYLNEQYKLGNFQASGRKVPRTGGVILSTVKNKQVLMEILEKDPFKIHNLASYEVIEFIPSKTSEDFSFLQENIVH
ncbi:YciI family protein [Kordia jejudonensis]|uniref:YciI family protein n=1 Tax=Kordia jejudonensis TaxID=1348245 RepID=UPI0006298A8D|nr:YciI family protein [Kordia jejudonensis]